MRRQSDRFSLTKIILAAGEKFPDSPRGLDPIQSGKTYIQKDQVWLQFFGFVNRFEPVAAFSDDVQFQVPSEESFRGNDARARNHQLRVRGSKLSPIKYLLIE